ncbi:hypothetical protein GCM10010168_09380 [Actinoplanes ianthinogenes]|uniref:HTH luxR-type domain-containing protein n=1 Tax=Actinoplanes ianthinogenes TaxID=122358 RepID=A0ABN6CF23_9ACTN|nr:LuxR C-terminal-related transcriptional regulator [Actinoplanes ianthinogenes]BCJ44125.1 hypothetical protein Aiant_47820 [Actinoplanes ianthinogenes]GGQ95944.1 hypothetical protein GCM10010168_09380 [Actinoplanes ianthinogenes]
MENDGVGGIFHWEHLDDEAVRVYEFATNRADVSTTEIAASLDVEEKAAIRAVERLSAAGLLRPAGRMDPRGSALEERFSAVPPDTARIQLLAPVIEHMAGLQQEVDRARLDMENLLPGYRASLLRRVCENSVERLHDLASVHQAITDLAGRCRGEVLTSQPGGPRSEEILQESLPRTTHLLERGVQMRTIYQHTAQYSPVTVSYVERVTALGAQVRTSAEGMYQMIVFDREVAVLPLLHDPVGALVVREPSIAGFAAEVFDRAWVDATPFATAIDRERTRWTTQDIKSRITRLLVEGLEDKAIARKMGMSLRSCQRHIADIMAQLGARNRFHAGYLIAQQELD